jgi:hypothetical protein
MHHDKLDLMINKTWLFNTRLVKILSYKIDEGKCVIVTDKDWITINSIDLNKKLKDFLPVAEEDAALVLSSRKGDVANITNTLLDTIRDIKEGKIDKVKINALNSTTNTILNVFKTEALLTKLKDR